MSSTSGVHVHNFAHCAVMSSAGWKVEDDMLVAQSQGQAIEQDGKFLMLDAISRCVTENVFGSDTKCLKRHSTAAKFNGIHSSPGQLKCQRYH